MINWIINGAGKATTQINEKNLFRIVWYAMKSSIRPNSRVTHHPNYRRYKMKYASPASDALQSSGYLRSMLHYDLSRYLQFHRANYNLQYLGNDRCDNIQHRQIHYAERLARKLSDSVDFYQRTAIVTHHLTDRSFRM